MTWADQYDVQNELLVGADGYTQEHKFRGVVYDPDTGEVYVRCFCGAHWIVTENGMAFHEWKEHVSFEVAGPC